MDKIVIIVFIISLLIGWVGYLFYNYIHNYTRFWMSYKRYHESLRIFKNFQHTLVNGGHGSIKTAILTIKV